MAIMVDIYSGHNDPSLVYEPRQTKQKKLSSSTRACFPLIWSTAISNTVLLLYMHPVSVPAQEKKANRTSPWGKHSCMGYRPNETILHYTSFMVPVGFRVL